MDKDIKKTLQKQLQLLSERSQARGSDLPSLSHAMVEVAALLQSTEHHSLTD